jgi:hypothetical protein
MVFEVIQAAERAGWTTDLVRTLYAARPNVPELAEIYEALGLATEVALQQAGAQTGAVQQSTAIGAEQLTDKPVDIGRWRERLTQIETCVCRVETDFGVQGTGFLVAPDLVLTCHSVLRDVGTNGARVRVRFDYRVTDGEVMSGIIVPTDADQWLVDHSTEEQLNYALIRLARRIGLEPLDPDGTFGAARSWLPIVAKPPAIVPAMPLVIVHYADRGPLRLSVDSHAVLGRSKDGRRFYYATETLPGAAGAPCFSFEWQLVGVHEGTFSSATGTRPGQGIPIASIQARLRRTKLAGLVAGDVVPSRPSLEDLDSPPEPGPILDPTDPQHGRWGGSPQRNGRKLCVTITDPGRTEYTFDVCVESTDGSQIRGPVLFHLHDSYEPSVIWIRRIAGGARACLFELRSYGVYTIGAQVRDATGAWTGLELNLASLVKLPPQYLNQ